MQGASLRDKEDGVQSFLQTKRRGIVSFLLLKIDSELHLRQQNNFDLKHVTCNLLSDITVRRALREIALGARVQQRKPFLSHEHVLTRLRFAQRYEIWTIDDWKRVIFNGKIKINMFNLDGRSWC